MSKNLPNSKKRKASESDEEGSTNSESENDDDYKSYYHDLIFDGFPKIIEAILDRRFVHLHLHPYLLHLHIQEHALHYFNHAERIFFVMKNFTQFTYLIVY